MASRGYLPRLGLSLAYRSKELLCPRLAPKHTCGCTSKKVVALGADTAHACSCSPPGKSMHTRAMSWVRKRYWWLGLFWLCRGMLPGIIPEPARHTLCVGSATRGISQMSWAVGNLNARGPHSAQWGSCLWLDLPPKPLPDVKEWYYESEVSSLLQTSMQQAACSPRGTPTPTGSQQSPAHPTAAGPMGMRNLSSRRAAQCSEIEIQCTSHLPTLLIKKQRKTLISCSINTASSSVTEPAPSTVGFVCKYEALALVHLSWTNSAFLSNLSKG